MERFEKVDILINNAGPRFNLGSTQEAVDELKIGAGVGNGGGIQMVQKMADGPVRTRVGHGIGAYPGKFGIGRALSRELVAPGHGES